MSADQTPNKSSEFSPRRLYGYSDFDYGFNLTPSQGADTPADLPIKFSSLRSATANWMTMNVGLDSVDLNVNNLELVNLVSEYVSCYFRFPEFGHPGVVSMDKVEESFVPYGGVDTRVFLTRPHISLIRSPLYTNSQALLVETEKGVYFRYVLDTYNSVRMYLNIYDVAAVLVKKYRPPSQSRGVRGSSGSGRGVRTLLEFLNLALSYHFSAVTNHIDVKVDLYNPVSVDADAEEEGTREVPASPAGRSKHRGEGIDAAHPLRHHHHRNDFVDLSRDGVMLEPAQISYPHCVYPLIQSTSDFTTNSCDIVTCYEDLTFCVNLLTEFVGGKKKQQRAGRSQNGEKKRYSTAKYKKKKADKAAAVAHQNMIANGADGQTAASGTPPSIFSVLSLTGVRFMIVDNVLGLHLPLVQLFLEDVQVNFDRDQDGNSRMSAAMSDSSGGGRGGRPASTRLQRAATFDVSSLVGLNPLGGGGSGLTSPHGDGESVAGSIPDDKQMRVFGKTILWAEYFNNMKKCWEPLLEKLVATVLFEKVCHWCKSIQLYLIIFFSVSHAWTRSDDPHSQRGAHEHLGRVLPHAERRAAHHADPDRPGRHPVRHRGESRARRDGVSQQRRRRLGLTGQLRDVRLPRRVSPHHELSACSGLQGRGHEYHSGRGQEEPAVFEAFWPYQVQVHQQAAQESPRVRF
jgi:hypothetical protein